MNIDDGPEDVLVQGLRRRVAELEEQLRLANIDNANTAAELAAALAGESDQSGEPRPAVAWTPAEWIHWWNRLSAEDRVSTVERIYDASRVMSDCILGHHEQRIAELTDSQEKLAATIAAFPDAHSAANLAHARRERDSHRAALKEILALAQGALDRYGLPGLVRDPSADGGDPDVPTSTLNDLVKVAAHVSRGRSAADDGKYPDALARRALGAIDDDILRHALDDGAPDA